MTAKMKLSWSSVSKLLEFYQSLLDECEHNSSQEAFIKMYKSAIETYKRGEEVIILKQTGKNDGHQMIKIGEHILPVLKSDLKSIN